MSKGKFILILFSMLMVLITIFATAGPSLAAPQKLKVLIGFEKGQSSTVRNDVLHHGGKIE